MQTVNNILVYRTTSPVNTCIANELGMRILDRPVPRGFCGRYHQITARYNYVPSEDYQHTIYVRAGEAFDAEAINNLGRPGAYSTTVDRAGIDEAIALLRSELGDLPVQSNLGVLHEATHRV